MKLEELLTGLPALLTPAPGEVLNQADYLQAAVTVPLLEVEGQAAVLFEVRARHMSWQPGDICFPGGRIEAVDQTPRSAAVRETAEELGIAEKDVAVLGSLRPLVSPIGILLRPFVASLSSRSLLRPNPAEVENVFTVPLEFLLASRPVIGQMEMATRPAEDFPLELLPAQYSRDFKIRANYPVLFYRYNEYVIWGLTARILAGFLDCCRQVSETERGRDSR